MPENATVSSLSFPSLVGLQSEAGTVPALRGVARAMVAMVAMVVLPSYVSRPLNLSLFLALDLLRRGSAVRFCLGFASRQESCVQVPIVPDEDPGAEVASV